MPPNDQTLARISEHITRREFDRAAALLKVALARNQSNADAHFLAANLEIERGDLDRALHHSQRSVRLRPEVTDFAVTLGEVHSRREEFERAAEVLATAAAADPSHYTAHLGLGKMLERLGRHSEAAEAFDGAARAVPGDSRSICHLGASLIVLGRCREAIARLQAALAARPANSPDPVLQQALCFALNYMPDAAPADVAFEHRRFGEMIGNVFPRHWSDEPGSRDIPSNRRLRIGYLSPDFREHAVAFFFLPILEHHDRSRFEVFCYSAHAAPDDTTRRIRALADQWRDVHTTYDLALATLIRDDGIDILIDLAGMTTRGRLPALALKSAPIQATWIGYPHSTGLVSVDYRFVDSNTDPPGADALCVERLVRLDPCFLCYQPPLNSPEPSPPPSAAKGSVTFGSFNALAKVVEPVVDAWAGVLRGVPGSRLIMKARGLSDEGVRRHLIELFEARSITSDRLEFAEYTHAVLGHLRRYADVDIALDTFPYNGTTTTCESLWMGVPVVTLEGQSHAGRVGLSLLRAVGLSELVARSPDEYVACAIALARDPDRLAALRSGLRAQVSASALCDAESFTRRLESVYLDLWRRGPQSPTPAGTPQ